MPAGGDAMEFKVGWPAGLPGRTAELEGVLLLLSDVEELSGPDIESLTQANLTGDGSPLVIFARGFSEDARKRLASAGLYAVRAQALGVETVEEILGDIAALTGGRVLSTALGAGMPGGAEPRRSPGGLVIPGFDWADVRREDLGLADAVSMDDSGFTIRNRPPRGIDAWLRHLAVQFEMSVSEADREAIARRFERFGREVPAGTAFRATDEIGRGAVSIPAGYASEFFVTDPERGLADLSGARVLCVACELTQAGHLVGALDAALAAEAAGAVVFAPRLAGGALAVMAVNKLMGRLPSLGVSVGGLDEGGWKLLGELAKATGGLVVDTPGALKSAQEAAWGRASRVMSGRSWTIVSP